MIIQYLFGILSDTGQKGSISVFNYENNMPVINNAHSVTAHKSNM